MVDSRTFYSVTHGNYIGKNFGHGHKPMNILHEGVCLEHAGQ
jgi:hypothetical protein